MLDHSINDDRIGLVTSEGGLVAKRRILSTEAMVQGMLFANAYHDKD